MCFQLVTVAIAYIRAVLRFPTNCFAATSRVDFPTRFHVYYDNYFLTNTAKTIIIKNRRGVLIQRNSINVTTFAVSKII